MSGLSGVRWAVVSAGGARHHVGREFILYEEDMRMTRILKLIKFIHFVDL
jgi:hypothetical protein